MEPENADALVSAIRYLYDHPKIAEALGLRGRSFVQERFAREQLTTQLQGHLVQLLEKSTSGRITDVSVAVQIVLVAEGYRRRSAADGISFRDELGAETTHGLHSLRLRRLRRLPGTGGYLRRLR